jgi:putative hydrolase of the HAD superfamily
MNIKHIFFDLDHTLWDFETNSNCAFKTIFEKHKVPVSLDKFLNYYRGINQEYWKLYREEKITKSALRVGRLKDTFTKINVTVSDKLIDDLSIDYIEVLPNYNELFEGALEILDYLKPKYEMHIITNGFNEVQYKKLKNSGLSPFFNQIITSEDVGVKKPNPIIFNYALKKAEANSKESIMIGDNYEADVIGAIDNGIDAIYFNTTNQPVSNTIKSVNTLLELKKYL